LRQKLAGKKQIIEEFINAHPNDSELIKLYQFTTLTTVIIQLGFATILSFWF